MNQLTRHFWFTFSALSVEFPLHSNEVYSVIPNRPALAEIVVVGSVSIILALLSGIVVWCFILKKTMENLAFTLAFKLFPKLLPGGILSQRDKRHSKKEDSAWQRRVGKFKRFDFSALKHKWRKQKILKEDKREKKVKEVKKKQREKEEPSEESSEEQEKKEQSPGEEKEKKGKKLKLAKRQRKQMILRKIKKTKSKLQQKYIKGKESLARKKLK